MSGAFFIFELMAKQYKDPGFGAKYGKRTKRIINKDGSFNIKRVGAASGVQDLYKTLVTVSWPKFLLGILAIYILVNLVFASIYFCLGTAALSGLENDNVLHHFLHCFYFSCQTFTTVGYGAIAPVSATASVASSIEALMGLLAFALATGLVYGRFSKANSKIKFSSFATICPYQDISSLQFRIINQRTNVLMEMEAEVTISIQAGNGDYTRTYHKLTLERDKIVFFPLSWTIVHPINTDSPLYGLTVQDLIDRDAEVFMLIKGFDDTFGQSVHTRHSYISSEIKATNGFERIFKTTEEGDILINVNDLDKVKA